MKKSVPKSVSAVIIIAVIAVCGFVYSRISLQPPLPEHLGPPVSMNKDLKFKNLKKQREQAEQSKKPKAQPKSETSDKPAADKN
jgi:hypothetical protein